MAVSPILAALDAQVTANTSVEASAALALRGVAARIQAAVDAALDGGATAAQLAPVQAEIDAMKSSADDLAAAVAENTPAAKR